MSNQEVRRPRRIIATPSVQGTPQAPANLARQAERFQRALNGRRPEAQAERANLMPRRARAGAVTLDSGTTPPTGTRDADARSAPPELSGDVRDDRLHPATAVSHAAGAGEGAGDVDDTSDALPGDQRIAHAIGAADERWMGDLVRAVVVLCARTDPAMQAWSVVLPMDERRLPATELHLSLSPHRLSLRFHSQSPQAVQLLLLHRPSLAAQLAQSLPRDRELDIDIT